MKSILRILVLCIAIVVCNVGPTQCQPWRYFQPEQDFQIGAVGLTWAKTAMDTLGIFFCRDYNIQPANLWQLHLDPAIDTTNTNIWNWLHTYTRWSWRNYKTVIHDSDSTVHYHVVGALGGLVGITRGMYCLENYPDYSADVQALPMDFVMPSLSRDSIMHDLIYPVTLTKLTSRHDTMMVAGPTYTEGFGFKRGYKALYTALGDSDRSTFFRFSYTLKTANIPTPGSPTDTIAYAVLYYRNRNGQGPSDCHCSVYTPFDTFYIHRSNLAGGVLVDPIKGYREYGKTINLSVGNKVYKHDSIVIERRYNGSGVWIQDTMTRADILYSPDTIVGNQYGRRFQSTIYVKSATRRDSVVEIWDSVETTRVPLYIPRQFDYAYGNASNWFGYGTNTSPCTAYCDSLLNNGIFPAGSINDPIVESDLQMRFFSTRIGDVTFARMRINQDLYDSLRNGVLDPLIKTEIDSLYTHGFDSIVTRVAYDDEVVNGRYRTGAYMARAVQNEFRSHGDTVRQLFQNPTSNFDGFRLFTEDFDSTATKLVQIMIRQDYHTFGPNTPIPLFYARLDSMHSIMRYTLFRAQNIMTRVVPYCRYEGNTIYIDSVNQTDTLPVMIVYNKLDQYRAYDSSFQLAFGKYLDSKGITSTVIGPFVPRTARAVEVARYKYPKNGPACPVWVMIEPRGWINAVDPSAGGRIRCEHGGRWYPFWDHPSPPTPELISAQAWLAINCSVNGFIYTDGVWDGAQFGYINAYTGDHTQEYDTLEMPNRDVLKNDSLGWTFPKMWVGFNSRFNVMARVNKEILKLDNLIHLTHMEFDGHQMSVFDANQHFRDMPLIDSLFTRQSQRLYRASGSSPYQMRDSSAVDPKNETYLEVTHWKPAPMDTVAVQRQSSYVLFTNRRVYPVDTIQYGPVALSYGADTMGLGFIDARRPVLYLKNSTSVIADSFLVEKVLDTSWHRTVAVHHTAGDTVALDFLTPGWGEMYRITPIPRAVSYYGTAFNNAQRVENPSLDTEVRPRIAVYERDSIIYMRLNHRDGTWSPEIMVSDSADADSSTRSRNINPAVAVVRNGNSALVVWEHRFGGSGGTSWSEIRARYFCARPDTGALPPSTRLTLSGEIKLGNDTMRTLAVVGVDSGYVVAWGTPYQGIELMALRDTVFSSGTAPNYISLGSTIVRAGNVSVQRLGQSPIILDSLSLFPTLAYVRNKQSVFFAHTHDVYLSWQQGGGASGVGPLIFFTPVGIRFTPGQRPTIVATAAVEHVSRDLPGCRFIHPCIAADTLRVGVTFEAVEQMSWKGIFNTPSTHVVVLRFRDSVTPGGQILLRWRTPAYAWSNGNVVYQYPSVVQFPNVPRATLRSGVPGGVAWYAPDGSGDSKVMLYHYRERGIDSSLRGVDPTMVRSPFAQSGSSYSTSGVFSRAPDTEKTTAMSPFGSLSEYYGAHLENTPSVPSALFVNRTPQGGAIFANFVLRQTAYDHASCEIPAIIGGIVIRNPIDPWDDGWLPIGIKFVTRLPPSFFAEPDSGNTVVDTITKIGTVVRTGVFHAPSGGVTIQWGIQGSSQLGTWLSAAPNDSLLHIPANIVASIQLVRASNNAVLWTSDTVSALSLMSPDPVGFETDIAADSLAGVDSLVYVRMFVYAPINLDYTMSTGFQFIDDPVNHFPKRVRRSNGEESSGEAKLTLSVHPNPANDRTTTVVVTSPFGDEAANLELYDITGTLLYDLGPVALKEGYGSGQLDVSRLKSGVYSLVIRQKGRVASTKLTVIR